MKKIANAAAAFAVFFFTRTFHRFYVHFYDTKRNENARKKYVVFMVALDKIGYFF